MMSRGMVSRGVSMNIRIDRCTFVTYIGDITIVMIGRVVNVLGSAIRKSNGIGSSHGTVDIGSFGGVEGSFGVVVVDTVLEGVGSRGLVLVGWSRVVRSRMVGSGSRSVLRSGNCACDQYTQIQKYLKQNKFVYYTVQLVLMSCTGIKPIIDFFSFFNFFPQYFL